MILALLDVSSKNAFAQQQASPDLDPPQTLHDRRLSEAVKQTSGLNENAQIEVGDSPLAVGIHVLTNTVYVANSGSDTVSVINAENNEKITDIPVGERPTAIGVSEAKGTVYVANYGSDSISVIDATDNEVVAGVTFQVNPLDSGHIECDGLSFPSSQDSFDLSFSQQQYYVLSGAECIAKPNPGFEFLSWEENLEGGSTQLINIARPASTWDSFVLAVTDFFGDKPDQPESKLNITKFGTFTANFRETPPPLPQEFWVQMYVVVGTVITGLFIPSIVGWFRSKRDVRKLNYFHKQVVSLYGDGKLDENDTGALDRLRNNIGNAYSEGKINEKHYKTLRGEISTLYEETFRKKIAALDSNNNNYSVVKKPIQQQLAQIRDEVELAFSKGKINEKHYDLLNKAISKLDSKEGVMLPKD
jgi:YVTN family beta-propeller protein